MLKKIYFISTLLCILLIVSSIAVNAEQETSEVVNSEAPEVETDVDTDEVKEETAFEETEKEEDLIVVEYNLINTPKQSEEEISDETEPEVEVEEITDVVSDTETEEEVSEEEEDVTEPEMDSDEDVFNPDDYEEVELIFDPEYEELDYDDGSDTSYDAEDSDEYSVVVEDVISRDNLELIFNDDGSIEISNLPKMDPWEVDDYLLSLGLDVEIMSVTYIYDDKTDELLYVIINEVDDIEDEEVEEVEEVEEAEEVLETVNSVKTTDIVNLKDNEVPAVETTEPPKADKVVKNDNADNFVINLPVMNLDTEEESPEEDSPIEKFFLDVMDIKKKGLAIENEDLDED